MTKQDKITIVFFIIIACLLIGVFAENIRSSLMVSGKPKINVTKVKEKIVQAGLVPYDARYWEVVK